MSCHCGVNWFTAIVEAYNGLIFDCIAFSFTLCQFATLLHFLISLCTICNMVAFNSFLNFFRSGYQSIRYIMQLCCKDIFGNV